MYIYIITMGKEYIPLGMPPLRPILSTGRMGRENGENGENGEKSGENGESGANGERPGMVKLM